MKIREATIQDYRTIRNLSIQLGHEYPIEKVKQNLSSILQDKEHRIFLAINPDSDEVIGYIHIQNYKTLYFDGLLNILGIIVDESWRNRGVGYALLQKAEKAAIEFGCTGLRAASSAERTNAHDFYRRNGFDVIKDQKRFVKIFNREAV